MSMLHIARANPLFAGLTDAEIEQVLRCTGAALCRFGRNETVLRGGDPVPKAGLLLSGSLLAVREDPFGARCLLSRIRPEQLFGLSVSFSHGRSADVFLYAETASEALMMDAKKLVAGCEAACATHPALLRNALALLADKNMALIRKQCHMSQHSLRGKLASYLMEQSQDGARRAFTIPFRRQELADFLGADRSALSAELSRMRRDGLIRFSRSDFTLTDAFFHQ